VQEDSNRVTCDYCGSTLYVARDDGHAALNAAEKSNQAGRAETPAAQQPGQPSAGAAWPAVPISDNKPWYRSLGCMIALFLFLTPAWSILILTDKKQSIVVKVIAAILLAFYVVAFAVAIAGQR